MLYSEFAKLESEERREILNTLPAEELKDLHDQKPFFAGGFENNDPSRKYFDNIEDLHAYLLEYVAPAAKPWRAGETAAHELAHAECALAVGAVGVKYYVLPRYDLATRTNVFTQFYGPTELPNLAWAAIAMYPYTASNSIADMNSIREYGYKSREEVVQRIVEWNKNEHGLFIPEPQKSPQMYPAFETE